MNKAAEEINKEITADGGSAVVERKIQEHNFMLGISSSTEKIVEYLNCSPIGYDYNKFTTLLELK